MNERQESEQRRSAGRPRKEDPRAERTPLGVRHLRMSAPEKPGFVRRWINDDDDRIERAQRAGYEFVTDPHLKNEDSSSVDTRWRRTVGHKDGGQPLYAYLMEIPRKYYEADQKAKAEELDEIDVQLRRGRVQGAHPADGGAFYETAQGRGIIVEHGSS